MFSIGEYIAYGANGICQIADICASPFDVKDTRQFYVLKSLTEKDRTIYTPTETANSIGRTPYTPDSLKALFSALSKVQPILVTEEKKRKDAYRTAMTNPIPENCLQMLKTVADRRAHCALQRKRLPAMDAEYEGLAKKLLMQEIEHVFRISGADAEEQLLAVIAQL